MRHTAVVTVILMLSLVTLLLTGCADGGSILPTPGPGVLTVDPSATRTIGYGYLSTTFFANVRGGNPPYSVVWDFGDGTDPSIGLRVAHLFELPGTYNVSCLVFDTEDVENGLGGNITSGYVECRVFFSGI